MKRRFNYTGRLRIQREHARITVNVPPRGVPTFTAQLELGGYKLPGEACVYVEAYRHTSHMRFDWGTVAAARPRNGCELSEFGTGEGVLFRVKVVEPAGGHVHGRPAQLLAVANGLTPRRLVESTEQSESLLPIDLREIDEIWRLEFDPDDTTGPVLFLNRRLVPDKTALVRSMEFTTLVLPQILRVVLERILQSTDGEASEEADDWRALWLSMARRLPGVGPLPPNDDDHRDDVEEWVNACVGAFSRSFRLEQGFSGWWSGVVAP